MIDRKQIILIKVALKQLGIGDAEYRAILGREYDVNSCTELTYQQASTLIDSLKDRGFRIKSKPRKRSKSPNIEHLVSPRELAILEHLRGDIHWRHSNGYIGLMKKVIGKDRIITSKDASKMIECLKAMSKRQNSPMTTPQPPFLRGNKEMEPF